MTREFSRKIRHPLATAGRFAGLLGCVALLCACSTVASVVPGADTLWSKETAGSQESEFPDLADTPGKPDAETARKKEKEISKGLVGDLEHANYTREEVVSGQDAVFANPPNTEAAEVGPEPDFPEFTPVETSSPTATVPQSPDAGDNGPMPEGGYEAGDPTLDPEARETPLE